MYDGELTYNYVVEGCGKSGLCDGTVATTTQTTVSVTTSIALTTTTKNGGVESKRELPASSSNLML